MAVERMQIKLMKEHQKVTEDRQVELDKLVRARKVSVLVGVAFINAFKAVDRSKRS